MSVKLRLQRKGRSKAPFYHIVAADARAPRDGRFIEKIGTYNPLTVPATIDINRERAYYWLTVGAQPTDTVRAILGFKGVLYQKHLQLGVKKGALTQEEADAKLTAWIEQKEASIQKRREKTAADKAKIAAEINGHPRQKQKQHLLFQ
ncbi:MAG: 30S ribosomal protein S16 [Saprospiraceae bacterium]